MWTNFASMMFVQRIFFCCSLPFTLMLRFGRPMSSSRISCNRGTVVRGRSNCDSSIQFLIVKSSLELLAFCIFVIVPQRKNMFVQQIIFCSSCKQLFRQCKRRTDLITSSHTKYGMGRNVTFIIFYQMRANDLRFPFWNVNWVYLKQSRFSESTYKQWNSQWYVYWLNPITWGHFQHGNRTKHRLSTDKTLPFEINVHLFAQVNDSFGFLPCKMAERTW